LTGAFSGLLYLYLLQNTTLKRSKNPNTFLHLTVHKATPRVSTTHPVQMVNARQRQRARDKKEQQSGKHMLTKSMQEKPSIAATQCALAHNDTQDVVHSSELHINTNINDTAPTLYVFCDDVFASIVTTLSMMLSMRSVCKHFKSCMERMWNADCFIDVPLFIHDFETFVTNRAFLHLYHGLLPLPFENVTINGQRCYGRRLAGDNIEFVEQAGNWCLDIFTDRFTINQLLSAVSEEKTFFNKFGRKMVVRSQLNESIAHIESRNEQRAYMFSMKRNLLKSQIDGTSMVEILGDTFFDDVPKAYITLHELPATLRSKVSLCADMKQARLEEICRIYFSEKMK
jgi:hypothetical protein